MRPFRLSRLGPPWPITPYAPPLGPGPQTRAPTWMARTHVHVTLRSSRARAPRPDRHGPGADSGTASLHSGPAPRGTGGLLVRPGQRAVSLPSGRPRVRTISRLARTLQVEPLQPRRRSTRPLLCTRPGTLRSAGSDLPPRRLRATGHCKDAGQDQTAARQPRINTISVKNRPARAQALGFHRSSRT